VKTVQREDIRGKTEANIQLRIEGQAFVFGKMPWKNNSKRMPSGLFFPADFKKTWSSLPCEKMNAKERPPGHSLL
jgi:hypothetical protein